MAYHFFPRWRNDRITDNHRKALKVIKGLIAEMDPDLERLSDSFRFMVLVMAAAFITGPSVEPLVKLTRYRRELVIEAYKNCGPLAFGPMMASTPYGWVTKTNVFRTYFGVTTWSPKVGQLLATIRTEDGCTGWHECSNPQPHFSTVLNRCAAYTAWECVPKTELMADLERISSLKAPGGSFGIYLVSCPVWVFAQSDRAHRREWRGSLPCP